MASPQKENGYTSIAHEIIEAIIKKELTGTQLKIILLLWRYTYGFNRNSHSISISFIAKALNVNKAYISVEVKKLISMNVIHVESEASWTATRVLIFNKNYDTWSCATTQQLTHNTTVVSDINLTVVPQHNSTVMPQHNQERYIKDILKKDVINDFFDSVWKLYPRKLGKGKVSDSQKKTLHKIGVDEITRCVERYKTVNIETPEQYLQHGSTFFNSGYVDFLDVNYKAETTEHSKGVKGVKNL